MSQKRDSLNNYVLRQKIQREIFSSAKTGDVEWLKKILSTQNVSLTMENEKGLACIHIAALDCRLNMLRFLIDEMKIDVNMRSRHGWTALHLCINNSSQAMSFKCAKCLISKGASVSIASESGITPLHQAATVGNVRVLQLLLSAGAEVYCLDVRGHSPFSLAMLWARRECARVLAHKQWQIDKDLEKELERRFEQHNVLLERKAQERTALQAVTRNIAAQFVYKEWMAKKQLVFSTSTDGEGCGDSDKETNLSRSSSTHERKLSRYMHGTPNAVVVVQGCESKSAETESPLLPRQSRKSADRHVDFIPLASVSMPSSKKGKNGASKIIRP